MTRGEGGRIQKGRFITFEGIEGSGKSLQIELLAKWLEENGLSPALTREPGGTAFGSRLRDVLLESGGPARTAESELLLYLADRFQDLRQIIEPALAQGRVVLCDRYHDATRAYQGVARGLGLRFIDSVSRPLRILRPDLTVLLDLPVETGLERARGRNMASSTRMGRFEEESLRFHRRVRSAYRALARAEPARFRVVPAAGSPEEVHRRVVRVVKPFLASRR